MAKLMARQFVLALLLSNTMILGAEPSDFGFQYSTEPGVYLSPYRLNGRPPQALEEFDSFYLERIAGQKQEIIANRAGDVPIGGALHTKEGDYKFKSAMLIRGESYYERLKFITATKNRVSYEFEGRYLENAEKVNGQYISLRGTLTKFRSGRKVATGKLSLYQWVKL
jgi:hypothetical protein